MASLASGEIEVDEGKDRSDGKRSGPPRDVRRYYCQFCGICRSKKSLIAAHVLAQHQDEVGRDGEDEVERMPRQNICKECGATFRKPAYLRQHMQCHSIERPFSCTVDDCHHSYRRKDHLARHLFQHQGKLFTCPVKGCNRQFAFQSNVHRHVDEMHDEKFSQDCQSKKYVCPEDGCGKEFKYPSRLRKHGDSHVKLEYSEVICGEPDCLKHFTNTECLKSHVKSCHQHIQCPICGAKQLKKNIKRHLRVHESKGVTEKIKCSFPGCLHSFCKRSNLNKHIKAIHLELRPFRCRISGCGLRFTYKHVRDKHETCGDHTFVEGDFLEVDEQFRSRPRGGRKRKNIAVESLLRKRIAADPEADDLLLNGTRYLSRILDDSRQETDVSSD